MPTRAELINQAMEIVAQEGNVVGSSVSFESRKAIADALYAPDRKKSSKQKPSSPRNGPHSKNRKPR